jgi:hypothetical protein
MVNFLNSLTQQSVCWYISVNDHKSIYMDLERYLDQSQDFEWCDDGARERCIEKDVLVTLRVYPTTPVGFVEIAGDTLEAVCAAMQSALTPPTLTHKPSPQTDAEQAN